MSRGIQKTLPTLGKLEPRKSKQSGLPRSAQYQQKEYAEQCSLFLFLRTYTHIHPRFGLVHASLNGINMAPADRNRADLSGRTKGVWDVFCPGVKQFVGEYGDESIAGLWIEMKATTDLTTEQKSFRDALQTQYAFIVCRDWITAARAICDYYEIHDPRIDDFLKVNTRATATKGVPAA